MPQTPTQGLAANLHAALQAGRAAAQHVRYSNPCAADITPTRQNGAELEKTSNNMTHTAFVTM
jgi:hypothetical protein